MVKKLLVVAVILALIGVCTGVYLWNKPHKKVENASAITVDARALAKEYAADEQAANAQYLNKAIEVKGTIEEIETNQEGGTMVILQTDDPAAGVQCSLRDKGVKVEKGAAITIRGFCSGSGITGVSLTDCIII